MELPDDDLIETVIPSKSKKGWPSSARRDLSQLEVDENRGKEGEDKCNTSVTYKDVLNVPSEESSISSIRSYQAAPA